MSNISKLANQFITTILDGSKRGSEASIEDFARSYLVSLIKSADPDAKKLFFSTESTFQFDLHELLRNEELARRYILYIISGLTQYPDIANRVKQKSFNHVSEVLTRNAKRIGESAYAAYLDKYIHIPDESKSEFFEYVQEKLITSNFEAVIKAVSAVHSPAPAQLIIAALEVLNSGVYTNVIVSWASSDFFSKTFPDIDLFHLIENYPWFEGHKTDVLSEHFTKDIISGIQRNKSDVESWTKLGALRYFLN